MARKQRRGRGGERWTSKGGQPPTYPAGRSQAAESVRTPSAALAYYNSCVAEQREMRGLKRPASSQEEPISGRTTRSKTAKVAIAAPPPPPAEEIVPPSPVPRQNVEVLSPPLSQEVKQVSAAAEPLCYVSLLENARNGREIYKAKWLEGRINYHNLEIELENEYRAANLGWKLLWNQKERITQLEKEKTALLDANRDLKNANVYLSNGQAYQAALKVRDRAEGNAISHLLLKDAAQAETRQVKLAAAEEKKKLEAEITELRKKLAAKDESIRKAFLE